MGDTNKEIKVCVTGKYDEQTGTIEGGETVEITVDGTNFTGDNAVDEALKQLKPAAADASEGDDAASAASTTAAASAASTTSTNVGAAAGTGTGDGSDAATGAATGAVKTNRDAPEEPDSAAENDLPPKKRSRTADDPAIPDTSIGPSAGDEANAALRRAQQDVKDAENALEQAKKMGRKELNLKDLIRHMTRRNLNWKISKIVKKLGGWYQSQAPSS